MDQQRYIRQMILHGFGEEGQGRLSRARVLVIGAGGLGCPALQYLVCSGIGYVGIVDGDTVALSNLHRQVLFSQEDIGKLKVGIVAKRLSVLNPGVTIKTYPFYIAQKNILNLIRGYDIVLDGTDNFSARYLISDACHLLGKPLVSAAVSGYEGQLAVFNMTDAFGQKTNYRDLFPVEPSAGEAPNCAENGVLGVLTGVLGVMQAAEAIKIITGIGEPLINKILNYNMLNQSVYGIAITPSPQGAYAVPENELEFMSAEYGGYHAAGCDTVQEIDFRHFIGLQARKETLVIDVRKAHELPGLDPVVYPGIFRSPSGELPDREIFETDIVLLCQYGTRSRVIAESLSERYGRAKNIYSLKGGVYRWNFFMTAHG